MTMNNETTGNEPVLSTGLSGNEPALGGPLGDGRSLKQLTDEEARQAGIFRFRFDIPCCTTQELRADIEAVVIKSVFTGMEADEIFGHLHLGLFEYLDTQTMLWVRPDTLERLENLET